jgi:hypothetical protein
MAVMSMQITVGDFVKWRPVFERNEPMRTAAGVTNPRIYRNADNPSDILLWFDVANVTKAREALGSQALKAAMQEAGVAGPPKVNFIE